MTRLQSMFVAATLSLAAIPISATAQTTVGTPTPGEGNCFPFSCNSTSSPSGQDIDYQQLYSSTAFSGPISFNTISFQDSGLNFSNFFPNSPPNPSLLAGDYDITFSTTSSPLGTEYQIGPVSNTETFYAGYLPSSGDFTGFSIAGGTYHYDPSQGNLLIEVVASNQAVTPNVGQPVNSYEAEDTSGDVLSRAYNETGGSSNSDGDGLVTTFSTSTAVSAAPEPSTWLLMFAGIGGIGLMMRRAKKTMGFRFKDGLSA